MHRQLEFNKTSQAIVVFEQVKDLLELKGSLKARKHITPQKARAIFEDYLAKRTR